MPESCVRGRVRLTEFEQAVGETQTFRCLLTTAAAGNGPLKGLGRLFEFAQPLLGPSEQRPTPPQEILRQPRPVEFAQHSRRGLQGTGGAQSAGRVVAGDRILLAARYLAQATLDIDGRVALVGGKLPEQSLVERPLHRLRVGVYRVAEGP